MAPGDRSSYIIWLNNSQEEYMPIDKDFLEILACPKCRGELTVTEKKDGLICPACKLVYEIRDEIPIMLVDQAKPLE